MVKLIKKEDSKLFSRQSFTKNAMFYKDMLAFYDAYEKLLSADINDIPSFCFKNGYVLEGICLFMQTYSSELGFETLNLSLDYLKTLYFTLASFSNDENFPERKLIEDEFENYKNRCELETEKTTEAQKIADLEFKNYCKEYESRSKVNFKKSFASNVFNFLSIFSLMFAIVGVVAPLTFYFLSLTELVVALIVSLLFAVIFIVISAVMRKLSKRYDTRENGTRYELQNAKWQRDEKKEVYSEVFMTYSKLLCESYECKNNLSLKLFEKVRLSFDEVLKRAKSYKFLSFNLKNDCIKFCDAHEREISEVRSEIESLSDSSNFDVLTKIYKKIEASDWLYFSTTVRFAFLLKFIKVAQKNLTWKLVDDETRISPFGLDVKAIAKQPVAFLNDRESLFVASTIDKIIDSAYLKNQNIFSLKSKPNEAKLSFIKFAYLTKFFDYEKIKQYNNIFYDKKIGAGTRVPDEIISRYKSIPEIVGIKLRLFEDEMRLGNNNSEVVIIFSKQFFSDDKMALSDEVGQMKKNSADDEKFKTVYECTNIDDIDDFRSLVIDGDKSHIGYKI